MEGISISDLTFVLRIIKNKSNNFTNKYRIVRKDTKYIKQA